MRSRWHEVVGVGLIQTYSEHLPNFKFQTLLR